MNWEVSFEKAANTQQLDVEFLYELASDFYNSNEHKAATVANLQQQRNYSSIRDEIHNLKNTSYVIGAYELHELVVAIHKQITENNLQNIDDMLSQLVVGIEATLEVCNRVMK